MTDLAHFLDLEIFELLSAYASEVEVECYVVGGFVRDMVLERDSKDFDILIIGSGVEFAQGFAKKLHPNTRVNIFKTYGTAQINTPRWEIEFVGARKESYHFDSRKPVVEDGTLEDDLSRRDFTINTLAVQLYPTLGKLVDLFNGMSDISEEIILTPLEPNKTFSDDPLRMLRAIRFAAQLHFNIATPTFDSIKENAERLSIISHERISSEFNKIMSSDNPGKGIKLLFDSKLLHQFFPELVSLQGIKVHKGLRHKDNFYHTLKVLDSVAAKTDNLWLRWAALLHDIAKPKTQKFIEGQGWTFHGHEDLGSRMAPKIFKRLKMPLDHRLKYVQKLIRLHLRPISLTKSEVSDSAVRRLLFEAGDDIEDLLLLCRCDITSKNEVKVRKYLKNFSVLEEKLAVVEENDRLRNWQPPIDGEKIMKTFGLKPGKEVGILKDSIRESILDGEIANTYEEAFALLLKKGAELGLEAV